MTNKEKIEQWLDTQIKVHKNKICKVSDDLTLRNLEVNLGKEVHIDPVREIARELGLEVKSVPFELEESYYTREIWFMYKGYKFFNLEG